MFANGGLFAHMGFISGLQDTICKKRDWQMEHTYS